MSQPKILIISHGHPDFNKGGAEVAAYNMFKELLGRGEDAYFLARTGLAPHGGAAFSVRNNEREILFHTTMDDPFLFSNIGSRQTWQEYVDLIKLIQPDVIHFHHYFLLGIELLELTRKTLPDSKIVLTMHEFLAICHRNGLMLKTNGNLCHKATPRDCNQCFPDIQPGDFFLRERYIKRLFSNVDQFISPSEFLKQRYVDWGLKDNLIEVIENGQNSSQSHKEHRESVESDVVRLAFFGQVNPFKGLDVLLNALTQLPKKVAKSVTLDIHGANLEHQSDTFKKRFSKLMDNCPVNVSFQGSYEPFEMASLLDITDWVIIPSIWWENSPMVIQEAFTNGVPLIVSDIGGMKEKVQHGVNGLHFRAGKSSSLAMVITDVVNDRRINKEMRSNITPPLSIEDCVSEHLNLYK